MESNNQILKMIINMIIKDFAISFFVTGLVVTISSIITKIILTQHGMKVSYIISQFSELKKLKGLKYKKVYRILHFIYLVSLILLGVNLIAIVVSAIWLTQL